jgi:Zn-dependent M28 family amino/carboxypeptidase
MTARIAALGLLALAVAQSADPPGLLDAWNGIHGDAIAKHIETLASDAYEGRAPGTPGEVRTLAYITHAFEEARLEPAGKGGYAQAVPLDAVTLTGTPKFSLAVGGKRIAPVLLDEWVPRAGRPVEHVNLEASDLVFAGYGCDAPEYGWNDYAGFDLRGKTVVLLRGDPGSATGDSTLFAGAATTRHGMGFTKFAAAARHGAKAAIVVHVDSTAGFPWAVIKTAGIAQTQHFLAEEPGDATADPALDAVVVVSDSTARAIFTAAGLNLEDEIAAASKRGFRAHAMAGKADIALDAKVERVISHNLIGIIPGAQAPDEAVVLMAHWDHMGINPALKGDQIMNGAVDNATGVAALIELVHAYKAMGRAPRRSVVFVATTAEERGLLGSEWLARHPVRPLGKTAMALAIDALFPYGPYDHMTLAGFGQTELEEPLALAASRMGRTLQDDGDAKAGAFYRADHWPWVKRGVPGFITVGGPANSASPDSNEVMKGLVDYVTNKYHRPSDEYDAKTWRMDGIEGDVRILFEFSWRVAEETRMPNFRWSSPYRALSDARSP